MYHQQVPLQAVGAAEGAATDVTDGAALVDQLVAPDALQRVEGAAAHWAPEPCRPATQRLLAHTAGGRPAGL